MEDGWKIDRTPSDRHDVFFCPTAKLKACLSLSLPRFTIALPLVNAYISGGDDGEYNVSFSFLIIPSCLNFSGE